MFLHALETGLISNNLRSRMRVFIQQPDITDAELIAQLNLAAAEESERNAKLGIGYREKPKSPKYRKGKQKSYQWWRISLPPRIRRQPPLRLKNQLLLSTSKCLPKSGHRRQTWHHWDKKWIEIQLESAGCKEENPQQHPQPKERNRGPRQNRRGCRQCFKNGQGETCTHCWKCGNANHFSYQCSQSQGNYPQLLQWDNQTLETQHRSPNFVTAVVQWNIQCLLVQDA